MNGGNGLALRVGAPLACGLLFLIGWEGLVRAYAIPVYILPGPIVVLQELWVSGPSLFGSLLITLRVTLVALLAAAGIGGLLAVVMTRWHWLELSLAPYAVILQVTPIIAIAPLIIIWMGDNTFIALVLCAWIIAFFPVLSNTTFGLNSTDRNLLDLFQLYGASRWQALRYLRLPSALPHFLSGLRISGGLALIGAVTAEYVAGTGGSETGIAWRILESSDRLQIPRMFAALILLSLAGIAIFLGLTWLQHRLLRHWHESALPRER
jgi:NitT/TauT family transport system permease protein